MKNLFIKLSFLLFLLISQSNFAQDSLVYQPNHMQKDLLKFKNALIKTHPGIYEYQTPQEFEEFMNHLLLKTSKPMEAKAFLKLVLKIVANIHDAHTSTIPFRKLGKIIKEHKRLPFQFYVKNQRIFIIRNMSKQSIPEGSEVLSIDDNISNVVVSEMFKHFSADGLSTSGVEHYLGVSYLSLNKLYPIIYDNKPSYKITYRDYKTKEIYTKNVSSVSKKDYLKIELENYHNNSKKFKKKAFDFKIDEEKKYAYLQITRFFKDSFQEPESTYPDYYKKCFKEIKEKKIKHLVIDLRDNDGGKLSNAAHLLRYFVKKPFTPTNEITTKGNDEYYLKVLGDTLTFNSDYGLERKINGDYKVTKSNYLTELNIFKPIDKYGFDGKIVVLIDGGSASAGGSGPAILQEYTDAIFVGSETFGTAGVGNGINKTYVLGDYTGVAISIPLMHGDIAINKYLKRRGVLPDYEISNSIEDIVNNKDFVLEFALEKLFEKRIKYTEKTH